MITNIPQNQITEKHRVLQKRRICFLIYTYNRVDTLPRAIESVLNQTFKDFELVIINNGSTDNTREILRNYEDHPRVRIIHLDVNIGSMRGMNFALDQINGEWFGLIGDDDYLFENAFEEAMRVVDEIDPEINAIAANCIATATGKFSGLGLEQSQYLSLETVIKKTSGDFFGLTKTELLGDDRLNEKLIGDANTLWYKLYARAKRYYIHKPLMVYNNLPGKTETSRIRKMDLQRRIDSYVELFNEQHYLEVTRRYNPGIFRARCLAGMFFLKLGDKSEAFLGYKSLLRSCTINVKERVICETISILPGPYLKIIYWLFLKIPFLKLGDLVK